MFKVTLLLLAIALCSFFQALRTAGVRLDSTSQEGNDFVAHDLIHGGTKTNLESMSIEAITYGHAPSTMDKPFFAVHETSFGGRDDNYYGLHATMGVYSHKLKPGQISEAGIWVNNRGDGVKSSLNSVEAGWHIYPDHYGDSHPHFYIQWTMDGYDATGCINMDCPGFVKLNGAVIAPGDAIGPISDVPDGNVQNITLRVFKDKKSGDWWVYYGFNSVVPTAVGYYPTSLFTYLADKASRMAFGGAVVANRTVPTPPMGSGSFPNYGQGRGAAFTELRIIDQDGNSKSIIADLPTLVTNDKCHSATPIDNGEFLYGGPGNCVT